MRYESLIGNITCYYELHGKQENKQYVIRFSYGRKIDEGTDYQFHSELISCKTFNAMQIALEELKNYCKKLDYQKVKSTKRHVITQY